MGIRCFGQPGIYSLFFWPQHPDLFWKPSPPTLVTRRIHGLSVSSCLPLAKTPHDPPELIRHLLPAAGILSRVAHRPNIPGVYALPKPFLEGLAMTSCYSDSMRDTFAVPSETWFFSFLKILGTLPVKLFLPALARVGLLLLTIK